MAVIATGFFDGVHLGHRHVIETLVSSARQKGEEAIVVTFGHHPRVVLQQDAMNLRLLNSTAEKVSLIRGLGVDRVEVLDFSRKFASMTASEYVESVLKGRFGATTLVMGYDNRLGYDKAGTEEMAGICRAAGLELVTVPPFAENGSSAVSSTRIRKCLERGDVEAAAGMLGYRYTMSGVVVSGNRIGRTIGFPTANMLPYDPLKIVPGRGCYCTEVTTSLGRFYGMTNIGVRPTVGGSGQLTIETNIFDFDSDIYGQDISVEYVSRLRDEVRFSSIAALKKQLESDREAIKKGMEHIH